MDSPLLVDMSIHTFDAARYVTGADPVSVQCTEFNPAWSWMTEMSGVLVVLDRSTAQP